MYISLFQSSGLIVLLGLLIGTNNGTGTHPVAQSRELTHRPSKNQTVIAQSTTLRTPPFGERPELPGVDFKVDVSIHPLKDAKVQWENPTLRRLKINYRIVNKTPETILILNRLPKATPKYEGSAPLEFDKNRLAWRMLYGEKDKQDRYKILGYDLGKFPMATPLSYSQNSSYLSRPTPVTSAVFIPGVTMLQPNEHFSEAAEIRWETDGSGVDFKRFCVSLVRQSDDQNKVLKQQPFYIFERREGLRAHPGSFLEQTFSSSGIKEYGICKPLELGFFEVKS